MKSLKVDDDVHKDLFLLKRIKNTATISDLIRLLMELSSFDKNFFTQWEVRFATGGSE